MTITETPRWLPEEKRPFPARRQTGASNSTPEATCETCIPVMQKNAVPKPSRGVSSAIDHSMATLPKKTSASAIVAGRDDCQVASHGSTPSRHGGPCGSDEGPMRPGTMSRGRYPGPRHD